MATTTKRKASTKEKDLNFNDLIVTLKKSAPQAKKFKRLSRTKLSEQLGVRNKRAPVKKEILNILDDYSGFIETVREAFEEERLDTWAKKSRQKDVENLKSLVKKGTLIESNEFLDQLGCTRQALSKARKDRRLFSIQIKNESYYPAFYVDPQYDRRHLYAVSKLLGDLPGTSKLQFMLTPKGSLNSLTPLDALAQGNISDVKNAAEGFAQR